MDEKKEEKMEETKHEYALIFNDSTWKNMIALQTRANYQSKSELIRRALGLLRYLWRQEEAGAKIIVRPKEGDEDIELLGLFKVETEDKKEEKIEGTKHRFTLIFTDRAWKTVEDLQTRTNSPTKAELIRRSLNLFDYLFGQKETGAQLISRRDEGDFLVDDWC